MILESDIAIPVVEYFEQANGDVYQEVQIAWGIRRDHNLGEGRADIVVVQDGLLGVVEVKRELSFDLLAQAHKWRPFVDRTWISFPFAKPSEGRQEAIRIALDHYGFGVLEICDEALKIHGEPRYVPRFSDALLHSLSPEHKTMARAGTNRGGHATTFKRTCATLAAYVADHPGCKLEEAVSSISHHYRSQASAVDSLRKPIKRGEIPGVYLGWRQGLYGSAENARVRVSR